MFLWWTKKKEEADVLADIEQAKHEIDDIRQDLTSAQLVRPSPVSKAKYSKWAVAEGNRKVGDSMRDQHDGLMSQRRETREEFIDAMHGRTEAAKEQREAAAERVRQHRANMAERGKQVKSLTNNQMTSKQDLRDQYKQEGARNAQIHGVELRERLVESRAERDEARRLAAQREKQAMFERAEAFQDATSRDIEAKRERVARIREQTRPQVAEESKQMFYYGRKAVADDVRESVGEWKKEQQANYMSALLRARSNRKSAQDTRKSAFDEKISLQESRRSDATAIRNNIKQIELHREHMKLSEEFTKREVHDEAFENKFVDSDDAAIVQSSSYDTLANQHRDGLDPDEIANRPADGRGNWMQWFGNPNDDGFFGGKSWFAWTS